MWTLVPRAVGFNKDGYAVAVGNQVAIPGITTKLGVKFGLGPKNVDKVLVIGLPTDHYDFVGPLDVKGKTVTEIRVEAIEFLHAKQQKWSILYIPSHSDYALSVCQGGPFETEEQAMTWFRENQGTEFDIDEDRVYLMSPDHRMQELSSSDCDMPTV